MRAMLLGLALLLVAVPAAEAARGLRAFGSCAELVRFGAAHVRDRVPVRVGAPGVVTLAAPTSARRDAPVAQSAAGAAGPEDQAAGDASGTNVQEPGIDEPDVVELAGDRLLVLADGRLLAVAATGDPRVLGALPLEGFGHQLLLRGSTALVLAQGPGGALLTEVDVGDPAAMRVRRTMAVPGTVVTARLAGATARVVVSGSPAVAEDPSLRDLVPATTLRSRVSGRTFRRGLVACDDVRRPVRPGGADLVTVLTIDLDRGLFSVDRDAVMAAPQAVYAASGSLYVASTTERGDRTLVHRFDASDPRTTRYRTSGEVEGTVLNQFSLSEHEGHLRIATTSGEAQASAVSVLREQDGALRVVGRVGGLGQGERIYAVRFLGDRGYVVTFRQVDPLYTLDLADPARPRVLGELKIEGYSAYLHPAGDGLLLGVGVDATSEGRRLGAQVSLFDVADPRAPRRLHARPLGEGTSTAVEFDHHAFLFWPATRTVVLPVSGPQPDGTFGTVARVLRAGRDALADRGTIAHRRDGLLGDVQRSLVAPGGRLLTVSGLGVAAHRMEDLAPQGFAAFPAAPQATGARP